MTLPFGLITAVTDDETASVATAGLGGIREIGVSPHTYHAVGRVLQEFGTAASTAGFPTRLAERSERLARCGPRGLESP